MRIHSMGGSRCSPRAGRAARSKPASASPARAGHTPRLHRHAGDDTRWGKHFKITLKGHIKDGVLIAEAQDAPLPWWQTAAAPASICSAASASVYQAMKRLADGYPDPKTGANTAISSAIEAKFTRVFIVHAPPAVAAASTATRAEHR